MLSAKQQLRDRLLVEGATTGVVRVQQQPLRPASLHTGALQNELHVYCHPTVWKTCESLCASVSFGRDPHANLQACQPACRGPLMFSL